MCVYADHVCEMIIFSRENSHDDEEEKKMRTEKEMLLFLVVGKSRVLSDARKLITDN